MTFSSIHIQIPFPLNHLSSCFIIIDSHFTVSDVIQKTLNQVYPSFNLNPNEYGIYVLPQDKWLFANCRLSDYIEYVSPLQIQEFQIRPKKLVTITVYCLKYKTTILCDPNQPVSMLSKKAAEIFSSQDYQSPNKGIQTSHSQFQNLSLLDISSPILKDDFDDANKSFFQWDFWSIWYKHRYVPDDTPCLMLNFTEVYMRRETQIQPNSYPLFKSSLREIILRERSIEKRERKERKEHRKEKKHSKMSDNDDNTNNAEQKPGELIRSSPLPLVNLKGPKPLALLNISSCQTSKSPRSPRTPRSSRSSHSSNKGSGEVLDSFFDKNEDQVPIFLEYLFQKIESNPKVEGIFRKSGLQLTIDNFNETADMMFKKYFFSNNPPPSSTFKDELKALIDAQQPHDIVGVLKSYLRLIPEYLIPPIFFDRLAKVSAIKELDKRLPLYKLILNSMPAANYSVLKRLSKCINVITSNSDENKMNLNNVVICMGPAIIKPAKNDDQLALINQSKLQSAVGNDIFDKKFMSFLFTRKSKKSIEVPSPVAKCIEKVDDAPQIVVGNSYSILNDDKQDKLTVSIAGNRQCEVPSSCFKREPPIKISPFNEWIIVNSSEKDVQFVYLPITSKNAAIGVNSEIKASIKKLKGVKNELVDEIGELEGILETLNEEGEDINKEEILKKIQEMSSIKDYLY